VRSESDDKGLEGIEQLEKEQDQSSQEGTPKRIDEKGKDRAVEWNIFGGSSSVSTSPAQMCS
jgi:hypothetical protein